MHSSGMMMRDKIDWTRNLGDAALVKQPDVMDAIPRLCAKAMTTRGLQRRMDEDPNAISDADPSAGSQPSRAPKSPVQPGACNHDDADNGEIAVFPLQLRHVLEVHAVDAGDCGWDCDDRKP
jgi:uncharacterized protein DUF3300